MKNVLPEQILPHRAPFLFVNQISQVANGAALATWVVRGDEDFLRGHFPTEAIVPGVLIGEALAQTAGIALSSVAGESAEPSRSGFLAHINLKFHAPARPPCTIELSATISGSMGTLHQFDVVAHYQSKRLASGVLVLAVPEITRTQ